MKRFNRKRFSRSTFRAAAFTVAATTLFGIPRLLFADSTTQPATAQPNDASPPTTRPSTEVRAASDQLKSSEKMLQALLGHDGLATDARRKEISPQAVPLLHQMLEELQIIATGPAGAKVTDGANQQTLAMLAALNDQSSIDALQQMAASKDPHTTVLGQGGQILARWYAAGRDPAAQSKVADDLEKLDRADPSDEHLTVLTARMSQTADSTLVGRMRSMATDEMSNPAATALKKQLDAIAKRDNLATATQSALLNKPLTIVGKTIQGKDFTTADLKGKVVLIDFWAVWCVPCRAGMPQVKRLYDQFHPQGLEIVGVSNDSDADKLEQYIDSEQIQWTQLFDVDAASNQKLNPISVGFNIDKIPVMFLIDRKGIVRSVTARQNLETMIPQLLAEPG